MTLTDHAAGPVLGVVGWSAAVLGAAWAATSSIDTGIITGGAAGLLAFLFRAWFRENKRKDEGVWELTDEYRIERDYERKRADHWQARWLDLVQPSGETQVPPMPNLEAMKAEARREKEAARGRRR